MGSSTLEWVGTAGFSVFAGGVVITWSAQAIRAKIDRERRARRIHRRARQAMAAATDAALDTEAFEPAALLHRVDEIFNVMTEVWAEDSPPSRGGTGAGADRTVGAGRGG